MKPKEIEGLARATCSWLAYRHLIDADSVYERLLLIPITEYLAAKTNWRPENELSYRDIFKNQSLPDHYADIAAKVKGGRQQFVLETKLLRDSATKQWSKIEFDVCRLGRPDGNVIRYFMLAGPQRYFDVPESFKTSKPSILFSRLLRFEYAEGFETKLDEFDDRRHYVRLCSDVSVSVDKVENYRLAIWSISAPSAAISTT